MKFTDAIKFWLHDQVLHPDLTSVTLKSKLESIPSGISRFVAAQAEPRPPELDAARQQVQGKSSPPELNGLHRTIRQAVLIDPQTIPCFFNDSIA